MAAPWVIFAFWVIRSSIYETNAGLYKGLGMFDFVELLYRLKEKRRTDEKYDRMKKVSFFWLKITAIWWIVCFLGFFTISIIHETLSK